MGGLANAEPSLKNLAYKIAQRLQSLRGRRVLADYQLGSDVDGLACLQTLSMSLEALELIDKCMPQTV